MGLTAIAWKHVCLRVCFFELEKSSPPRKPTNPESLLGATKNVQGSAGDAALRVSSTACKRRNRFEIAGRSLSSYGN